MQVGLDWFGFCGGGSILSAFAELRWSLFISHPPALLRYIKDRTYGTNLQNLICVNSSQDSQDTSSNNN